MSWRVQVRDEKRRPITNATVSLRPRGAQLEYPPKQDPTDHDSVTHEHSSTDGTYEKHPKSPKVTAGKYLLIVSAPGKSTVIQPLDIAGSAGTPLQATIPEHHPQAATVSLPNKKVNAGTGGPGVAIIVMMYPASQVVFVEGIDWPTQDKSIGGTAVPGHSKYRRGLLFKKYDTNPSQPFIDEGTHVVVFSMGDDWMRVFAKAHDNWLLIGEFYIISHIKQVYAHLDNVGRNAPGSVRELSFFSHGWVEGPILVNTYDRREPWDRRRSANDYDPRMKDFDPPNLSKWSKLPAAFHPQGEFRSWGCYAVPCLVNLAGYVNNKGENAPFVLIESKDDHGNTTIEHTNGPIAKQVYLEHLLLHPYVPHAAQVLGAGNRAYGAAPGTWSGYTDQVFKIPWEKDQPDRSSFDTIKRFLRKHVPAALPPDHYGYIDYTKLSTTDVPSVRPNAEYIRVIDDHKGWFVSFHHHPGVRVAGATGKPKVDIKRLPDVSKLLSPALPQISFPPVPAKTPGAVHTLSRGGMVAVFVVAELLVGNTGGLRVFRMDVADGKPHGVLAETLQEHRVQLVRGSATMKAGVPVEVWYWDIPKGGSIGIAPKGSGDCQATRHTRINTSPSGKTGVTTTQMVPGEYVIRCYDRGGAMLGQAHHSVTLT